MTTPGGVPNLPKGALTVGTLASMLQDMSTPAMRGRAAERMPGIFDSSSGGNPLSDLSPFGILTQIFAGFNSFVANADPADINGPEDLPGLLLDFIESLPVIGQLVGLFEAIMGTYDGDDTVLIEIQKIWQAIRDLFGVLNFLDLPPVDEVWDAIANTFMVGIFAIPADVQASINMAMGYTKAALEGTYIGTDPVFLAVQAAAVQWLTGSSDLNAAKLIGTVDDGRLPSLGAVRDAIYQAINGGSTTGITAAQVKTAVAGQQAAVTAAGSDASAALSQWANFLSGGSWASVAAAASDFLATKSTATTASSTASSAASDASTALSDAAAAAAAAAAAQSDAAAAGSDASTALGNWTSLLSGGSWASAAAAAADLLSTKSTASAAQSAAASASSAAATADAKAVTADGKAVTAGTNASTALSNFSSLYSGLSVANAAALASSLLGTKNTATTANTNATTAQSAADAAADDAAAAQSTAADAQSTAVTAEATAVTTITQLWNRIGGNNDPVASSSQADSALGTLMSTVGQLSSQVADLVAKANEANGFSASVQFRQAETTVYDSAGNFNYTLPPWFNTSTDFLDSVAVGAGSGGGAGISDYSTPGGSSIFRVNGVAKATGTGGAGVPPNSGLHPKGHSPGDQVYLDILYPGGGECAVMAAGSEPGGGGGGGSFSFVNGNGGLAGQWATTTMNPGTISGAVTGTVGGGGAGTPIFPGTGGGKGADGRVWVRARKAMPSVLTSLGTKILPTFRLNSGVALTDAMTAAGTWSRVPPGGAAGGHMLKIRANTAGTAYVYLRIWVVSGVTNYEIGRVSGGTKYAWKTGTVGDAVPFNTWSISSDDAYTFTVAVNGSAFDSYTDAGSTSAKGSSNREGHWATSDTLAGGSGSIVQFAFMDSGTPSRITSAEVAAAGTTTSTSYGNLSNTGPSVTLTVPLTGEVTVDVSALFQTSALLQQGFMGVALSGANTEAASDAKAASITGNPSGGVQGVMSRRLHYTGLNPGTTTFQAQYRTSAGTATFSNRMIIVDPRP